MSWSQAIVMGNMTRDVECRFTQGGMAIGSFTVAVNRKWKGDNGEAKEEVSYIDCTAFGKTAETVSQHFKKGSPICVIGRLKQDTWEDKNGGGKRSKLGVVVEQFQFMGGNKSEGGTTTTKPATQSAPKPVEPKEEKLDKDDDSVPF